jgi:hypothetical protein
VKNFSFVLWMLFYPLVVTLDSILCKKFLNKEYDESVKAVATFVSLGIYIYVALKLWRIS